MCAHVIATDQSVNRFTGLNISLLAPPLLHARLGFSYSLFPDPGGGGAVDTKTAQYKETSLVTGTGSSEGPTNAHLGKMFHRILIHSKSYFTALVGQKCVIFCLKIFNFIEN